MYADACQGPKAFSSMEDEARAVFFALMNTSAKFCILLDAKEVVDALNSCCDRVINSIILAIKCSVSSFDYVKFILVPISKHEGAHMLAKLIYCLNQDFILDWGRDQRGDG